MRLKFEGGNFSQGVAPTAQSWFGFEVYVVGWLVFACLISSWGGGGKVPRRTACARDGLPCSSDGVCQWLAEGGPLT